MLDLSLQSGKLLFLDGAMGTMLQSAGLPAGVSPEFFCMERPDVLEGIHKAYVQAGSDILTTCTFGGNKYKLPQGLDVINFNEKMAQVARSASKGAGREIYIAGNLGPTGHFVRPLGDIEPQDLIDAYAEQVRGLVRGGVDVIFIETQFDLAEARAAVIAVRRECNLPVMVSMTFEQGVSLTGSTPEIFVETMQNLGVTAVGTNCSAGPEQMVGVIDEMLKFANVPILIEPNAGLPELVDGQTVFRLDPESFAQKTAVFAKAGVSILGGCCGTSPDHIAALKQAVNGIELNKHTVSKTNNIVLTTRSSIVRIGEDYPLTIIGERINPTGKKQLTAELQAQEFGLAMRYAQEQITAGAPMLDVNVGAPLVDEAILLPELVKNLVGRYEVPLSLDSSNISAINAALPYCPGSALVNSISGEKGRMEELGPVCRDFGAPFILLPLQGRNLPVLASERIAILENLLEQVDLLGIPRRLVMVDVLALAVSSKAEAGKECLETIRWCMRNGLPTTIGLSNVSFGLPARELLNSTYLSLCVGAGLSSCIGNPDNVRLCEVRDASAVLLNKDKDAQNFIENYAQWTSGAVTSSSHMQNKTQTTITSLYDAVLLGDKDNVIGFVQAELDNGADPMALVQEKLIPAITEVGVKYEKREYFLPQLIRSAETMQKAFGHVKPLLEQMRGKEERPVIVLATVEGDIHDIGKNIVALLLGNHGFEVVDAGKDVKAEDIVKVAIKHKASIIGLSALMTTTMVRMEDTVKIVQEQKLPFKIMIGGAVVTQAFADSIAAHGYSADAVGAVRLAKTLL